MQRSGTDNEALTWHFYVTTTRRARARATRHHNYGIRLRLVWLRVAFH